MGEVRKQTEAKKDEDEDAILPADKLDSLKALFWDRYHVNPLPDEWPSDRLLSRISKNLEKHTLDIQDVWAIKSLLWQKTNPVKKRKLGENLYLAEDVDEHNRASASDGPTYLFNLKTYFMALAIAGASPLPVVPADAERLGSDSTLYVVVPWDLLQRYLRRAEKYWVSCHSPLKLNNLVRLDLEDRGEWTHRFSTRPSATLGAIIKEVMMEREAVWVSSSGPASSAPAPAPEPANPPSAAARQASLDQRVNAPPLPKVIDQLRDGTPLRLISRKVVALNVVVTVQRASIVVDTFLKEVEFVDPISMQVTSALPRTASEKLVSRRVLGSLRLRPPRLLQLAGTASDDASFIYPDGAILALIAGTKRTGGRGEEEGRGAPTGGDTASEERTTRRIVTAKPFWTFTRAEDQASATARPASRRASA